MLRLFNTMGHCMQDFVPITQGFVGFYGCGPTVYNYAHIGNLRAYVFLDTLDRTLEFLGYKKRHVMNITDIGHLSGDGDDGEDKMLKSAIEKRQSVLEIANFYTKAFFADCDSLNIRRPDVVCRATEHIEDMIALIKRLEERGHTYSAGGNLYYDVTTFPDYCKLGNLDLSKVAVSRVAEDKNKRHASDFVLWFTKSKYSAQALTWSSPWGVGYPGWHIECSAMSMKYLGEHFDIHTGGVDHIKVHHTNEIAQSEGATGHKWVNYWLHNEFLVIKKTASGGNEEKMSKSAGNFLTLSSLVEKGYSPLDYRYFLLGTHYRVQAAFSFSALDGAKSAHLALVKRVARLISCGSGKAADCAKGSSLLSQFQEAIEDDLNTPRALGVLQKAVKESSSIDDIKKMDSVLGLNLIQDAQKLISAPQVIASSSDSALPVSAKEIEDLIQKRAAAKKARDFSTADKIRADLLSRGITLIDTKEGTKYEVVH